MKAEQTRSKDEIAEDIERNRYEIAAMFKRTKRAAVERNPVRLAWVATRAKFASAKTRAARKARHANNLVRDHVYRNAGLALLGGIVVGLFIPGRRSSR